MWRVIGFSSSVKFRQLTAFIFHVFLCGMTGVCNVVMTAGNLRCMCFELVKIAHVTCKNQWRLGANSVTYVLCHMTHENQWLLASVTSHLEQFVQWCLLELKKWCTLKNKVIHSVAIEEWFLLPQRTNFLKIMFYFLFFHILKNRIPLQRTLWNRTVLCMLKVPIVAKMVLLCRYLAVITRKRILVHNDLWCIVSDLNY